MIKLINCSAHDTGLPAESVHMIATSPPYWGLRAYAGEQGVDWPAVDFAPMPGLSPIHVPAMRCDLGLEPTPEAYIGHLILVMREMWRVLREDGTCWVNLGDSYNNFRVSMNGQSVHQGELRNKPSGRRAVSHNLKEKDLCQIPARFALAAQADGWWVRSDIIWAKPNPMPESVTDRPTKGHEYIYMLAKSERYYYDHVAVKEPMSEATKQRDKYGFSGAFKGQYSGTPGEERWQDGRPIKESKFFSDTGRNRRTVWTVATRPYSGAHFATWPPELVRPMIRAGTSARGVCPACGAPWARVVERTKTSNTEVTAPKSKTREAQGLQSKSSNLHDSGWRERERNIGGREDGFTPPPQWENGQNPTTTTTVDWQPTCPHADLDPIPATVLDPFSGSGTTGMVAIEEGREYIGVDISQAYLEDLAPERLTAQIGLGL